MSYFDHASVRTVGWVMGAALMIRRGVMDRVGGFDESYHFYGEETDYCFRASREGYHVYFYPGAEIIHYGSGSPQLRQIYFDNLHASVLHFLKKHHGGIRLYVMLSMRTAGVLVRVPVYFILGVVTADAALIRKSLYYLRVLF